MRAPRRLKPGQAAELVEHLGELRSRLFISIAALAVGFAVSYVFRGHLIHWLNSPLSPAHRRPVTFGIAEPFLTSMKVSLYAGFALALPVILWQLWSFLAPALARHLQRTISTMVVFATGLFAVGVGFGYKIVLPAAVHFLTNFDSNHYTILVRAGTYYSFALLVLLAVGLVFELPVFILALVRVGALSSHTLRRKRRLGYVLVAALAVALPGVDPVTTLFEMVPLLLLFEASIWLSVLFERRWLVSALDRDAASQSAA